MKGWNEPFMGINFRKPLPAHGIMVFYAFKYIKQFHKCKRTCADQEYSVSGEKGLVLKILLVVFKIGIYGPQGSNCFSKDSFPVFLKKHKYSCGFPVTALPPPPPHKLSPTLICPWRTSILWCVSAVKVLTRLCG